MTATRRSILWLVSWFATAIAAGLFFAWLLAPENAHRLSSGLAEDPAAYPRVEDASLFTADPALTPAGRPPEPQPPAETRVEARPPEEPAEAFEPPAEGTPGVACYILVEVIPPPGVRSASGEAYALGAGAPGVDELEDVPHADANNEEPGLIPLDRAGVYDVGFTWHGLAVVQPNVTVLDGGTTPVTFRLAAYEPVFAHLRDPLPDLPGGSVYATLGLTPVSASKARQYPGRDERVNQSWARRLKPDRTSVGRLMPGDRVRADAYLYQWRKKPSNRHVRLESHVAVCSPQVVGPGDRVDIHVLPAARLYVRMRVSPARWPTGVERVMKLRAHHAGGTSRKPFEICRSGSATEEDTYSFVWVLPVGEVRVEWDGIDQRAGVRDGITLRAGETTELELRPEFTGSLPRASAPLWVTVVGEPAEDEDDNVQLAWLGRDSRGRPETCTEGIDEDGSEELSAECGIRQAGRAVAVAGRWWTTGPLDVTTARDLQLRLRRGGLLALVVEVERPENAGKLRIRRKDGLPLHEADEGFEVEMEARTGRVLGPFAPGVHVFEVRLGRRRLPDVRAVVRAGRASPLVIPH